MPPVPEPGRSNAPDSSWTCPSCGSTATTRYCGNCGERNIARLVPIAGTAAATEPSRSYLARLRASLRALASPPGQLTSNWIRGRRVGYLAPLALFLWINVAFFVIQSVSGLGILTWPLRVHLSDGWINWLTTWLLARHRPFQPGRRPSLRSKSQRAGRYSPERHRLRARTRARPRPALPAG